MQDQEKSFYVLKKILDDLIGKAIKKGVFPGAVIGISIGDPAIRKKIVLS